MADITTKAKKIEHCALILKAVAHPIRIAIIELLKDNKKTVSEIHLNLNIEQAVASHHLGILKNKGVLNSSREGKNMYYELKHQQISKIIEIMEKCSNL